MRITAIPIDDPRWREFTSSHPDASPFHLPEWASLIADCYGFDAFVLAARDTDGEILAGAPTIAARSPFGTVRWVSLPFSDSVPLLVRPDVAMPDVVEALTEFALAGPAGGLQIRTALPDATNLFPVDVGYIHQMELPRDPTDLRPHKSQRANRNKAQRMGVRIVRGGTPQDMATFYRLQTLTRMRHGVPVQPRRFFDLIQDRILAPGHGFVATAVLDGRPLAAGVYLHHNGMLMAKYHASDPAVPFTGAGHLIEWETMVRGCTDGFRTLDIGRTDPGHEGLREYKSGWGHIERPLVYTHISRTAPGEGRASVGALPKFIIRTSPPWVCRGLGELFYRWTA